MLYKKRFSILSKLRLEPNRGLMDMLDLNMISHLYYATSKEHTKKLYMMPGHWECFQNFVLKD